MSLHRLHHKYTKVSVAMSKNDGCHLNKLTTLRKSKLEEYEKLKKFK